jgi:hypothetical protein
MRKTRKNTEDQVKIKGERQLHRNNCKNQIRKIYTNKFGEQISLVGRYSFEWSVIVTDHNSKTKIKTFASRKEAVEEFNMIIKIYQ